MLFHQLTHGIESARIGLDRFDIWRWRWRRCSQEIFENPNSAHYRLGFDAIGSGGKNTAMTKQTTAMVIRL